LQFTLRGDERIPLQGGTDAEDAFSVVEYVANDGSLLPKPPRGILLGPTGLTAEGYQINSGSSFMLVTAFTSQGLNARALLS
jgi:acyl-homoserine-lactone acylase